MKILIRLLQLFLIYTVLAVFTTSAYADGAAEMARKLQNPLANIKAVMTDNTIGFDGGPNEDTTYSFQLQPVYSGHQRKMEHDIARRALSSAGSVISRSA